MRTIFALILILLLPTAARASTVTFANGMMLTKDHLTYTVAPGCLPDAECTFTSVVQLGIGQQFSNVQYSCAS